MRDKGKVENQSGRSNFSGAPEKQGIKLKAEIIINT